MSRGWQRKIKVRVGEPAPEFTLQSQDGKTFNLRDIVGSRNIILYFYPRDDTPGCTTEASAFRDHYGTIRNSYDAEIIGVSSDSVDSHKNFASRCELPFTLLSDEGGCVRRTYGVSSTLGIIPGRVTYIIDKKGIVRCIFSSQFGPRKHVEKAIEALNILRSEEDTSN